MMVLILFGLLLSAPSQASATHACRLNAPCHDARYRPRKTKLACFDGNPQAFAKIRRRQPLVPVSWAECDDIQDRSCVFSVETPCLRPGPCPKREVAKVRLEATAEGAVVWAAVPIAVPAGHAAVSGVNLALPPRLPPLRSESRPPP